jgi:hypothetical protein
MSFNESSYEQTRVMQDALEMAVRLTENGDARRSEIADVILNIANQHSYDASALANLALAEMAESSRKTA